MNAWIGHYIYREDNMKKDKPLTKTTYKKLNHGDVIENIKTRSRYVVIATKNAGDPIVQIKKDDIRNRLKEFQIIMKVLK